MLYLQFHLSFGFKKMRFLSFLICFFLTIPLHAQFAFELKVNYSRQVQNSNQYAVSGSVLSGKIENNKTYYLEDGTQFDVKNIISAKSATSVPVALQNENISMNIVSKKFEVMQGETIHCITNRPGYGGESVRTYANKIPDGMVQCKVNGKLYEGRSVSKPVLMRQADVMDLFFISEETQSVIWIQINNFSQIRDTPHLLKSDTSIHDRSLVCKLAFMPKGYRPTDMPNNYLAFEDYKGNAGVMITHIDRYKKKFSLEFSGILRPNELLLEERPNAGLFYITEGRVDAVYWEEY